MTPEEARDFTRAKERLDRAQEAVAALFAAKQRSVETKITSADLECCEWIAEDPQPKE